MRATILVVVFLSIPVLAAAQTTWYVPDDFPTIQGAISDASVVSGDTIIVRPGTYIEALSFLGKAISVRSKQGPGVTVIDGNFEGSVVTFNNYETPDTLLEGFTITHGNWKWGGGIFCYHSSPTISGNIIIENTAELGGGICCWVSASPILVDNTITENTAVCGGGIGCSNSSPIVTRNTVSKNIGDFYGGGIGCLDSSSPSIINNTIAENSTGNKAPGGGIYCSHSSPTLFNNIIACNQATGDGGGICCYDDSSLMVMNNIIYGNYTTKIPADGGGICCKGSSLILTNNTVYGNTSVSFGGGIYCESSSTISNTILWNNTANLGQEVFGNPTVSFSNIKDGWSGTGNIDSDPLFVDGSKGDFHLKWVSPCINRGTIENAPSDDIDGDPRPYLGIVDMGADEFIGTHTFESDTFSVSESSGGTVNFTLIGGVENFNRDYLVLGSISGTAPGIPLPGGLETLRLKWDVFTNYVVPLINTSIFTGFLGTLNGLGTGTAQLNAPPVPGFAGITMYFAYGLNYPWDFVSNPVAVEILP